MSLRQILIHPDPRLKKMCEPVARVTPEIEALADDMLATMYDAPGVGLAAPQVGVMSRIFVMDATRDPEAERRPMVLINPEIAWSSDDLNTYDEGCLSVPEQYGEVTRAKQVKVRYLDETGREMELEADGMLATCIQHEIDHLKGKVFVQYLSQLKQTRIRSKLKKRLRETL